MAPQMLVSFASAMFVLGPTLNDLVFAIFACYPVDDGESGNYPGNQKVGRCGYDMV